MVDPVASVKNCAQKHSAFIYDRGGKRKLYDLHDLTQVRWERRRDQISEASLLITGDACRDQEATFQKIRANRHELVLFRGEDRVWEGPLHRPEYGASSVRLVAQDVSKYPMGTPLTQTWDNTGTNATEATTRLANILTSELTSWWGPYSPSINIVPFITAHHSAGEARTAAKTLPFEKTVGDHLLDMGRTGGVDWTAIGRAIHLWDVSAPVMGRTRVLTEADFIGGVIVSEYGANVALDLYVVGQQGTYGEAHVTDPELRAFYGPWTKILTPYDEDASATPTQSELDSQASRNLTGRAPAPIVVRVPDGSTLVLSEDLTINQLVPGVRMPVRATLNAIQVTQEQKLDVMVVTDSAAGEEIKVTLSPAAKPDTDV